MEAFDDPTDALLFPEEEALISAAVAKRRREFTTVRHCARQALARIGFDPMPILRGEQGAPIWPAGVVGSMTHCPGYRAAAVGRADRFATIGVDAEEHAPLPAGVLSMVALPEERARIVDLTAADPAVHWDRLLFSAKESVYKAWFPLTRRWLGFDEAEIVIDPAARIWVAHLLVPGPRLAGREVTRFEGRFAVGSDLVVTAVSLAVPG